MAYRRYQMRARPSGALFILFAVTAVVCERRSCRHVEGSSSSYSESGRNSRKSSRKSKNSGESSSRDFHCLGGSSRPPSLRQYVSLAKNVSAPSACGFCEGAPATQYLQRVAERLRSLSATRCSELVVYSAALGNNFAATSFVDEDLAGALSKRNLWHANGRNCYFRFVLTTDKSANKQESTGKLLERLVRLDPAQLPFPEREMRRNVKIFKMIGHKLFQWAKRTVWIDAKLRIGSINPRAFFKSHVEQLGVCASYMGLPLHPNAYGEHLLQPSLRRHGETIMMAALRRPSVTDNIGVVGAQISHYASRDETYSPYLVDTAYIARDFRSPRCRAFNSAFGCTWFDEIDCFSDRDQLSFPAAVRRLALTQPDDSDSEHKQGVLLDAMRRPALYIQPPGSEKEPGPHWYFSNALAVGKCPTCHGHANTTVAAAFRAAKDAKKAKKAKKDGKDHGILWDRDE